MTDKVALITGANKRQLCLVPAKAWLGARTDAFKPWRFVPQ